MCFKCTVLWYLICMSHCATPTKVKSSSFTIYLAPLTLHYSPTSFFWQPLYCCLCLWVFVYLKMWFIYTMEYYSARRKNKILSFATTWMGRKNIMLTEISQSENANNHYDFTHKWDCILFYGKVIFHYIYIYIHTITSFTLVCWWVVGLFPYLGLL